MRREIYERYFEKYPYYNMSIVGITKSNIEIFIRTDDPRSEVPHFHFRNPEAKIFKEGCIRIDSPRYFNHSWKRNHLNSKQIKELVEFLNEPFKGSKRINGTNWEYLIFQWNTNNSDLIIDEDQPIPDYMKLINE